MKDNPSSPDRPVADSPSSSGSAFRRLFASGVMGWAVGILALFGASWIFTRPESVPVAMLWVISNWWIAFLFGLRGDLFTYLPVVLVFYGFGSLWMSGGREAGDSPAFMRAVIPSLVGGLMILGFVAVPAFASDSFRYRDAFELKIAKTVLKDGSMLTEGSLAIRKPGTYQFSAPRYVWDAMASMESTEPEIEFGEIQWGAAGAPKEGALGEYPMRIVWRKGIPPAGATQLPPYEDLVVLEVRRPDEDNKLVYSVSAPMALD